MKKSFATDDHIELIKAAGGQMFTFFERSDKMTKSASDVITRKDMQDHMPPDSHFGVHVITMGSEEAFGPNRNGDSASIKSLNDHHGTFEKFGCVYREHANRNPLTQGVGDVRLAKVNPKMHRGELLAWVDKDKAPDMYKAACEGKELSWSMSMRLPHDECSCCHKKSARVDQYCDHLKSNMLQWIPGFEKYAYARNEEGVKFFDISEVKRRADRIATYLGYYGDDELMAKAASADDMVISGAEWADYQLGPDRVAPFLPWEDLTLEKLAAAEEFVRHADQHTLDTLAKMTPRTLNKEQVEILANPDFRSVGGELAKRAMFIDFPTFASIVTGKSQDELSKEAGFSDVMGIKIPSLISDMFSKGGCECGDDVAASVVPDDVGCSFSSDKDSIDRLLNEVGDDLGMKPANTSNRVMRVTVVKQARVGNTSNNKDLDPFYNGMAEAYGHYLVKAAHIAKDVPTVSENTLFRVLAASLVIQS